MLPELDCESSSRGLDSAKGTFPATVEIWWLKFCFEAVHLRDA